jgi:hypothetical protein
MKAKGGHRFAPLLAMELRRLWRGALPWLLAAATLLFLLYGADWQASGLGRYDEFVGWMPLIGGALSALAAWNARREARSGVDDVLLAWPVTSWRVGLARALALGSLTLLLWVETALPLAAHTVLSYASAARVAGVALPLGRALHDAGLIGLSLAASLAGAQALGQVAGAILPGIAALVAVLLFRLGALVLPSVVMGTMQWPWVLALSPDFSFSGWSGYSEGWGYALHRQAFLTHRLLWLGMGLTAILGLALLWRVRRDGPWGRAAGIAATVLVAAVAAALPFVRHEQSRVQAFGQVVAEYGEPVKPGLEHNRGAIQPEDAASAPTPLRYELAVDLTQPPEATIRAALAMEAGPEVQRDTLALTLRRTFQVDSVQVEGRPVPPERIRRQGDLLELALEQPLPLREPVTVTLSYHGRIEDWRLEPYETPAALLQGDLAYLPAGWGWYPVPGRHTLTYELGLSSMVYRAIVDREGPLNDAEPFFDVTVRLPSGVRTLAGFGPQGDGTWRLAEARNRLGLIGGDWWQLERDGIRYAVPFEALGRWQEATADLHRLLLAIADWTGIEPEAVIPSTIPRQRTDELGVLDAAWFAQSFHTSNEADTLVWNLQPWLYGRCMPRYSPTEAWEALPLAARVLEARREAGEEQPLFDLTSLGWRLLEHAEAGIVAEALGAGAAQGSLSEAVQPEGALVDRWAARTPLEVQKAELRQLFTTARQRLLTPADLAFLDEGGAR